MGRTIPSYRIATAIEKGRWKPFREMLNRKDKKLFDQMLCYPNLYNSAGSNAVRPVLLEPIIMSIVFEHYKQLDKLQKSVEK
ncbi:MAG: hypothetical protein ACM3ZS_07495 [Nitrososphaerota archaeon]